MYLISSRGQPTRGGPPASWLDEVLTTPYRKNASYCESTSKPPTWADTLVHSKQRKSDMRYGLDRTSSGTGGGYLGLR
jgi:hypothetical protein